MQRLKMPVMVNPFGVMYNPYSVASVFRMLIEGKSYTPDQLVYRNGVWFSFDHYTGFSSPDRERCLTNINRAHFGAKDFLQKTGVILVTFGTARYYRFRETGKVVANCHKLPASEFSRELMDVDAVVELWSELISDLRVLLPEVRFIFTVSPIRHWKDGAVANQYSKSILHVAIQRLIARFADCAFYFPAYELMMDDLRDYRFYDSDMLHPSPVAINYIWERFANSLIDRRAVELSEQIDRVLKATEHRPINPHTSAHQRFVRSTMSRIERLAETHPYLNFETELSLLAQQLDE